MGRTSPISGGQMKNCIYEYDDQNAIALSQMDEKSSHDNDNAAVARPNIVGNEYNQ